ncbi:MAG: C_GCAxxG_C_C family protein [Clostridia bacterium]|nr:C_GCAxxG_C_C family protein [Clostridia bacterium]MBQ9988901.1 C_GCAxxG_C_C family protein [Clostridia bacterium]
MSKKTEKAIELFNNGYNCAQAAYLATRNEMPDVSEEAAARMSAAFGGGVGGLGHTCGAVCGAVMALGEVLYPAPNGPEEEKSAARAAMRNLGLAFEKEFGSCMCADLKDTAPAREDGLKPCTAYVEWCVEQAEKLL